MKTKEKKRQEAEARKEEYAKLTAVQKLAKVEASPYTATWERNKLAHLIIKESEGKITKAEINIPGEGNQRKKPYQKPKKS